MTAYFLTNFSSLRWPYLSIALSLIAFRKPWQTFQLRRNGLLDSTTIRISSVGWNPRNWCSCIEGEFSLFWVSLWYDGLTRSQTPFTLWYNMDPCKNSADDIILPCRNSTPKSSRHGHSSLPRRSTRRRTSPCLLLVVKDVRVTFPFLRWYQICKRNTRLG